MNIDKDIYSQEQAIEDYEKTLEGWLGNITKEDIAKVLKKLGQWRKLPYSRLVSLYLDLCTYCGACANECHIYRARARKQFNPAYRARLLRSVYLRHFTLRGKIFRGLVGVKKLDERILKEWFKDFYQCTMCRSCNTFCPLGVDNMAVIRIGRALISEALGKTTADMGKGARTHVRDGNAPGIKEAAFHNTVEFWKEEIKEAKGWDVEIPIDRVGAEIFLMPPNSDFFRSLEATEGVAATLYAANADWTISSRMFDAANCGVFYDDAVWLKIASMQIEEAKRLKCETLVVGECGHATKSLMFLAPSLIGSLPFEVKSVLQVTADYIEQGKIKLNKEANPEPVTYHDPCNLSRMCGLIEEPRIILKAACGNFTEVVPNRDKNYCCGGGGG